jgi:hypothetical protein
VFESDIRVAESTLGNSQDKLSPGGVLSYFKSSEVDSQGDDGSCEGRDSNCDESGSSRRKSLRDGLDQKCDRVFDSVDVYAGWPWDLV